MDGTREGAGLWRRRLRTSWQAIVWGLLCCASGLLYGLPTTGQQSDTTATDVMSVLNVVLLFVGLCVGGLGVLGWCVSMIALRRYDTDRRQVPLAAPRFARLSVLPWAFALLFLASGLSAPLAPGALCSVGAGSHVDVHVEGTVGRARPKASGEYRTPDGNQGVVVQDATPPVGATVRACVGWLGSDRAWTRYPWLGLMVLLAVGIPLVLVEAALVRFAVRGPARTAGTVNRRHSVV